MAYQTHTDRQTGRQRWRKIKIGEERKHKKGDKYIEQMKNTTFLYLARAVW
jgi:hypothetical protein